MIFKDSAGTETSLQDIVNLISADHEYEIFVGSDSQIHKKLKKVVYVTCVVLYKKGKGGKIFMSREPQKFSPCLRERLMNEVWRSLSVAFEMKKILPANVELIIHVDVNPKKKFKSSDYCQELVNMVTGQGFKCRVKPDAFGASNVADKFSK
jgi:hypothetical protein